MDDDKTFNKFVVALGSQGVIIMNPPRGPISNDDALNLAAWLVSLADYSGDKFQALLKEIQNS